MDASTDAGLVEGLGRRLHAIKKPPKGLWLRDEILMPTNQHLVATDQLWCFQRWLLTDLPG